MLKTTKQVELDHSTLKLDGSFQLKMKFIFVAGNLFRR